MLLGNPHFPWVGSERFFQSQITIPGKMNASGASLLGVPIILIGHNRNLAWSHTVSTAFRFVPFRETLVPGNPRAYYVDGEPRQMDATTVTVQVREPDGSLRPVTRTLYRTIHGPVVNSLQGQPLFPWTEDTAYTMHDANATNFRFLNHFFNASRAQSVDGMLRVLRKTQGVPWVNTIAADTQGKALYADISVVPNVPDEKVTECNTPGIGELAHASLGLPVLDGSRSECDLRPGPGSAGTDNMPPSRMPFMVRTDYAMNANDSYWLSNTRQPLEGFDRIIGTERTARSLRTRLGLIMIDRRLAGTDGREGRRFTLRQLKHTIYGNRELSGELWRGELVDYCRANPTMNGNSGPVDVSEACEVLARWDLRVNADSRGALLWRRFVNRLGTGPGTFDVPFDPDDPVNTPRGLNTDNPDVEWALATAVSDLEGAGIPLDAPLGETQYVTRNGERIPIHGGPGALGTFNVISTSWRSGEGLSEPTHGSSFIIAASMNGKKCPKVKTILTYSQAATNPESPHYADQTRVYSAKRWYRDRFCRAGQLASPGLVIKEFRGGSRAVGEGW
jgi:acyl-homoserine-lactone acylase